jgi:hypothetical protein
VIRSDPDDEHSRTGAEDQLKRNGCTRIDHCTDGNRMSYGTVERGDVVRQRMLLPTYN